ncbi:hypothetical protein QTP88_009328 [Uroleucon formosanum]
MISGCTPAIDIKCQFNLNIWVQCSVRINFSAAELSKGFFRKSFSSLSRNYPFKLFNVPSISGVTGVRYVSMWRFGVQVIRCNNHSLVRISRAELHDNRLGTRPISSTNPL